MFAVPECRDSRALCRTRDIEWPARAVEHVRHGERAVGPAQAQAGQPVCLREGARHHHVVELRDHLAARFVVALAHVLGIGGIDH